MDCSSRSGHGPGEVRGEPHYLLNTGGRFLLTGKGCSDQCGHDDFEYREDKSSAYFLIVTGSEISSLWLCAGSHLFVQYTAAEKMKLAASSKLEAMEIPLFSMLFGHGYLQHAGTEWRGKQSLRYHTYLVPQKYKLLDTVAFAYGACIRKDTEYSTGDASRDHRGTSSVDEERGRGGSKEWLSSCESSDN